MQHLVSSLSVSGRPVHRLRENRFTKGLGGHVYTFVHIAPLPQLDELHIDGSYDINMLQLVTGVNGARKM